jgi:hypothetical protein
MQCVAHQHHTVASGREGAAQDSVQLIFPTLDRLATGPKSLRRQTKALDDMPYIFDQNPRHPVQTYFDLGRLEIGVEAQSFEKISVLQVFPCYSA